MTFYLSFIPDCFRVSGRNSSWCCKCVCPIVMAQLLPLWRDSGNAGVLVDEVAGQRLGMGWWAVSDSHSSQCLRFCQCEHFIPVWNRYSDLCAYNWAMWGFCCFYFERSHWRWCGCTVLTAGVPDQVTSNNINKWWKTGENAASAT